MRYSLKLFTCGVVISLVILGCSSQTSPPAEKTDSKSEVTTKSPSESPTTGEESRKLPDFPDSPTTLTLYSVDFRDEEKANRDEKRDGKERLLNYLVLGKTEIKDPEKRKSIMAAFKQAIREPAEPTKCFDPRHGLKVVDEKGVTEIVICFHCFQYISTGAHPARYETISAKPQELLDSILKEAGIEILPGMEELMKQKRDQEEFEKELR